MIKQVIEDNVKVFEDEFLPILVDNNLFYGAFSMLSILHLFKCKNILKAYEDILIENYNKEIIYYNEDETIEHKFANLAGRNIRLYQNAKNISPIEIFLLNNKPKQALKFQEEMFTSNTSVSRKSIKLSKEQLDRIEHLLNQKQLNSEYKLSNGCFCITDFGKEKQKSSFKSPLFIVSILMIICVIVTIPFLVDFGKLYYGNELRGEGTQTSPYLLYNQKQFKQLGEKTNSYFRVMRDLDLSNLDTIENLDNFVDGQNHYITINSTLFDNISENGTINDVNINFSTNSSITVNDYEKGFICNVNNGFINDVTFQFSCEYFSGISIYHSSSEPTSMIGLICGTNNGKMNDCWALQGKVKSCHLYSTQKENDCFVGAIAGQNYGTIENSFNQLDIDSSYQDVGGVCGINRENAVVFKCGNRGDISVSNTKENWSALAGGITAHNNGEITNCQNTKSVTSNCINSEARAGGIAANFGKGTIKRCRNSGSITATGKTTSIGGIVGISEQNTELEYCLNNGDVTSTSSTSDGFAGGIIGTCKSTVAYCITESCKVSAIKDTRNYWIARAGGIAGAAGNGETDYITITHCISLASLERKQGNICGWHNNHLYDSTNYWYNSATYSDASNENNVFGTGYNSLKTLRELTLYKQIMEVISNE